MASDSSRQLDTLDGSDLRLLVELSRLGSINQAAKACGVGQPAASKRLQRISKALGFDVIATDGASAQLTPGGRKIAAHGERVLKSLDQLLRDLD